MAVVVKTRLMHCGINYNSDEKCFILAATKVKPVRNNFAKNVIVVSSLLRRRWRSCAQTNSQKPKHQKLFWLTKSNLNFNGIGYCTLVLIVMLMKKVRLDAATKVKPVRSNFAKNVIVVSSLLRRCWRSCAQTKCQKPKKQKLFDLTKYNLHSTSSGCETRLLHSGVNCDVEEKS